MLAFASTFTGIAAATAIWTLGEMIMLPASAAYVAEIAPPGRSGQYMGFYQMAFALAFASGPLVGATLLERCGATTLWTVMFAMAAVAAAMMLTVRGVPAALPAGGSR